MISVHSVMARTRVFRSRLPLLERGERFKDGVLLLVQFPVCLVRPFRACLNILGLLHGSCGEESQHARLASSVDRERRRARYRLPFRRHLYHGGQSCGVHNLVRGCEACLLCLPRDRPFCTSFGRFRLGALPLPTLLYLTIVRLCFLRDNRRLRGIALLSNYLYGPASVRFATVFRGDGCPNGVRTIAWGGSSRCRRVMMDGCGDGSRGASGKGRHAGEEAYRGVLCAIVIAGTLCGISRRLHVGGVGQRLRRLYRGIQGGKSKCAHVRVRRCPTASGLCQ